MKRNWGFISWPWFGPEHTIKDTFLPHIGGICFGPYLVHIWPMKVMPWFISPVLICSGPRSHHVFILGLSEVTPQTPAGRTSGSVRLGLRPKVQMTEDVHCGGEASESDEMKSHRTEVSTVINCPTSGRVSATFHLCQKPETRCSYRINVKQFWQQKEETWLRKGLEGIICRTVMISGLWPSVRKALMVDCSAFCSVDISTRFIH